MTSDADGKLAHSPFLDVEDAIEEVARLGYDGIESPLKAILNIGPEKYLYFNGKHLFTVLEMLKRILNS